MKITLTQLRAFVTVARSGSFTQAGEILGMSQPSVTSAIKQLEQALEVKLFDRTTKKLGLTPASLPFLPVIERILKDLDATLDDFQSVAAGTQGNVAISVLPSVATNILPNAIATFSQSYPNIRLSLRDDNSFAIMERVRRGEIDLGVAGHTDHDEGLSFKPLLRDPFGLVVRYDHPLARDTGPVTWAEMADFPFISFAADTGIRPLLDTLTDVPDNIQVPWVEVSNIATLIALLQTNLGIAALPQMTVKTMGEEIVFRVLLDPPLFRELGLITRRGQSLSPAASHFAQHLEKAFLPAWER